MKIGFVEPKRRSYLKLKLVSNFELLELNLLKKNWINYFVHNSGIRREEGIRTLDTLLAYTHFPGVRLRPLGHLSIIL